MGFCSKRGLEDECPIDLNLGNVYKKKWFSFLTLVAIGSVELNGQLLIRGQNGNNCRCISDVFRF